MEITDAQNEPKQAGVRPLMTSACAGIFVFGIVMAVLGAILPSLFPRSSLTRAKPATSFFT